MSRRPRPHSSQPVTSTPRIAVGRNLNLSQPTIEESFSELEINIDVHVNNVVRFILSRAATHKTLKKAEIYRSVIGKAGRKFEDIMTAVRKILIDVYGLNLLVCDTAAGKGKEYIVSNALQHIKDPSENLEECPEDIRKILLLLILSHVFMGNNSVTDASLYDFLKSLQIDVELRHELFGNVREYITKTLVKQQYVNLEMDDMSKQHYFSWGQRAEKEISKHSVLEFVCKMYRDKLPKDWVNQFKEANLQGFENTQEGIHINE